MRGVTAIGNRDRLQRCCRCSSSSFGGVVVVVVVIAAPCGGRQLLGPFILAADRTIDDAVVVIMPDAVVRVEL